jgi:hypothetical protein
MSKTAKFGKKTQGILGVNLGGGAIFFYWLPQRTPQLPLVTFENLC